jgi:crossover junction endodeoxyribonuclease RusA
VVVVAVDAMAAWRVGGEGARVVRPDQAAEGGAIPVTAHTITLPYPVSANRYWRSFVPRGSSRAVTVVSDEAKDYRRTVALLAKQQGMRLPLDGRVELTLRLYPARPQDWAKRAQRDPDHWDDDVRCIDLGNAEKVLSDALNGIAWIDDKQLRRIVSERCEPDGEARVEVTIAPLRRQAVAPDLFAVAG